MRIDPVALELQPDSIPADWILAGKPEARVTKLLTSSDWTASVVVSDTPMDRSNGITRKTKRYFLYPVKRS